MHPQTCRHFYPQSHGPKKASVSFVLLAQKHDSKADYGRYRGFLMLPDSHVLLLPHITQRCFEIQTPAVWVPMQMCKFALLWPQPPAAKRLEATFQQRGTGCPLARGDSPCCQPLQQDKGLPETLQMGPKSSWSSGYLYSFTKSRQPKTTDCIYFLLKNLLFLLISL